MLKVGSPAPSFVAGTTAGAPLSLASLRGKWVVLYFFKRAFTRWCTVETKGFRDNYDDLRALGAEVVGVSSDEHAKQCEFSRAHGVTFPMVADTDHKIARSFDVLFAFFPVVHRVTYVIDPDGNVAAAFHHEFQVSRHLDDVLKFVRSATQR